MGTQLKYEILWSDDLNTVENPLQEEFFTTLTSAEVRMKELIKSYESMAPCGFTISLWNLTYDTEGKQWRSLRKGYLNGKYILPEKK